MSETEIPQIPNLELLHHRFILGNGPAELRDESRSKLQAEVEEKSE